MYSNIFFSFLIFFSLLNHQLKAQKNLAIAQSSQTIDDSDHIFKHFLKELPQLAIKEEAVVLCKKIDHVVPEFYISRAGAIRLDYRFHSVRGLCKMGVTALPAIIQVLAEKEYSTIFQQNTLYTIRYIAKNIGNEEEYNYSDYHDLLKHTTRIAKLFKEVEKRKKIGFERAKIILKQFAHQYQGEKQKRLLQLANFPLKLYDDEVTALTNILKNKAQLMDTARIEIVNAIGRLGYLLSNHSEDNSSDSIKKAAIITLIENIDFKITSNGRLAGKSNAEIQMTNLYPAKQALLQINFSYYKEPIYENPHKIQRLTKEFSFEEAQQHPVISIAIDMLAKKNLSKKVALILPKNRRELLLKFAKKYNGQEKERLIKLTSLPYY